MEKNKTYQFCLNTPNNCFLCFGEVIVYNTQEIKYSPIQNVFQYLKIPLNEFNSLCNKPLDILNKTQVWAKLCSECDSILESFSKHFKSLELARMRVEHELNKIQKRLKMKQNVFQTDEIEDQKHSKLVAEIRKRLDEKCELKTSRVLPRIDLVRIEISSESALLSQEITSHVDKQKTSSNPVADVEPEIKLKDSFKVDLNHIKVEGSQEDPLDVFHDESEDIPFSPIHNPNIGSTTPPPSPQETKCSICGKIFAHRKALALHKKRHNPVKRFSCESCGKALHGKGDLTRHIRTHTREKPHKCPHCPASFGVKGNLHQHVRDVHNKALTPGGIKRFRCEHCERIFKHTRDIRKHLHGTGCRALYSLAPTVLPDTIELKINSTDK